jgi:hypothetical protein
MPSWEQVIGVVLAIPGVVVSVLGIWEWIEKHKKEP